jgi:hypothetical protein
MSPTHALAKSLGVLALLLLREISAAHGNDVVDGVLVRDHLRGWLTR